MEKSITKGLCFGLTSGIITTLGLIVGLHSFTGSKLFVIGGIMTIAIADSFSDALGIHISEESTKVKDKDVWIATGSTFLAKLVFSLTFIIPFLLFDLSFAVKVSVVWGMVMLTVLSYYTAGQQKEHYIKVIGEHLLIAVLVVVLTHYVGDWIASVFGYF